MLGSTEPEPTDLLRSALQTSKGVANVCSDRPPLVSRRALARPQFPSLRRQACAADAFSIPRGSPYLSHLLIGANAMRNIQSECQTTHSTTEHTERGIIVANVSRQVCASESRKYAVNQRYSR